MKYWRETLAVAQRILIELWRRRRSLIFWSIFPISVLLLNGFILAERAKLSTAKALKVLPPLRW
jgi:ABC-2 type transport system permease protein